MKIKKVDDKPMVIHTKQKTKIHTVEAKKVAIKGRNILTVDRSPKIKGSELNQKKVNYRKSTVHRVDKVKKGRLSQYRQNVKDAKQSIKTKDSTIKLVGAAGANTALEQMEGGDEIKQAALVAYGATRPVTSTASKGAELFRQKVMQDRKRKIKKVNAGKKIANKSAKKAVKDTAKATAKKAAKDTAKTVAKETAKATAKGVTTVATTTAGTAISPGVGTAIGIGAGYVTGVAIDYKDMQATNRSRKIKFFLDKMNAQEQQKDSLAKLVKDLIVSKVSMWVKAVAPIIGLVFLVLALLISIVAIPVIAVIAIIYNSPFAIFFPPLEDGDTVMTVASAYVAEFNREVTTLATNHEGCDDGIIVYVDYEGMEATPSNYYDILAVYMVKHGVGDTATIMNDTSRRWLQTVVDDMCSYTTTSGTENVVTENADGTTTTTTKTVLYVNVTLKSYIDMISEYGFNAEQEEMLREFMSPEYLAMLGWTGGGGGGDPGVCSLTEEEIQAALSSIPEGPAKQACDYALHRVGYPYSQELRHSGEYYDCSSLVYYAWLDAGVDISYGGASSASWEAKGLADGGKTVTYDELQAGDLIFYSYSNNGQYLNITHVAIYVGNGKVVEARGTAYGVVYRDVPNLGSIVMIGRPS